MQTIKATTELLRLERGTVRYGAITALDQVSLLVEAGEIVAVLGANGAGKTSLMRCVMGLTKLAIGTLYFFGENIAALPPAERARRGLGYSPEGRRVFPGMTVRENLEVACHLPTAAKARALEDIFGLFPVLAERRAVLAWQLSGGQQQMLAIGRALMNRPKLVVLDELSLGLAPMLVDEVLERVQTIRSRGTAVLLAEQSVARALAIADRAYVLKIGRVVAEGNAKKIATDPRMADAYLGA